MLDLKQKKLKKKILDNLVLRIGDIIKTEKINPQTSETITIFGVYFGHVDVDFTNKKVTIDYYVTDAKESTYSGPKELLTGGQMFQVRYSEVSRPRILEGKELADYQAKFKKNT